MIGIEIRRSLAAAARERADRQGSTTPVTIIHGDAAALEGDHGTVFYLFNPFGERTMSLVLRQLTASFRRHPRRIRIVYTNPRFAALLDAADWLERDGPMIGMTQIWHSISA